MKANCISAGLEQLIYKLIKTLELLRTRLLCDSFGSGIHLQAFGHARIRILLILFSVHTRMKQNFYSHMRIQQFLVLICVSIFSRARIRILLFLFSFHTRMKQEFQFSYAYRVRTPHAYRSNHYCTATVGISISQETFAHEFRCTRD